MLTGVDLVFPLEMDDEDDPAQDDEMNLVRSDGSVELHLKVGDPGVERDGDNPILLFNFRDVPPGFYTLSHRIGQQWVTVLDGIRVTRSDVLLGDDSLQGSYDASVMGSPDPDEVKQDELPGIEPEDDFLDGYNPHSLVDE